jgi:hypothetical protein
MGEASRFTDSCTDRRPLHARPFAIDGRAIARPRHFRLPTSRGAGCLERPSRLYEFRVGLRAFYVWISVGPRASARTRAALVTLLDGMRIARYARP